MGSKNARKILEATNEKPMSASEISKNCSIPLTKVYRWLQRLENCKLLMLSGIINEKGRKVRLYKSGVTMIMINPTESKSPKVEILGSGNTIKCVECGSSNCNLIFDKKSNKTNAQCMDCEMKYKETLSHLLKEEQQKFIVLESLSDSHAHREEQQKMYLLETLLEVSKKNSK